MKQFVTVFSFLVLLFGISNLAVGQSMNIAPVTSKPKVVEQLNGPLKFSHSDSPLEFTTQLAYFDVDSSHQFALYQIPNQITLNVPNLDPFNITQFSERFTPVTKGTWYLDSAVVAFRADTIKGSLKVYAIKASRGGTLNYLYPFGAIIDSAVIGPEQITDNINVYPYTVKFHHNKLLASQGSFFIGVSVGDSGNALSFDGDQIADADPSGATIDTNVDRSYWTATSTVDGKTTYAGFMAGGYQDASGNLLAPNLVIISYLSNPASGVSTLTADHLELGQNYPNAASDRTTIDYSLNNTSLVSLKVFNSIGQEVETLVNGVQASGSHSTVLDASVLPSGMYYYTLQAGDHAETRTMTVTH